MPRLFKQPKTKPIPAGSRIVEAKGGVKLAKWTDAKGREHSALLTLDGTGIRVLSTKWYGEYRDADGRKVREPLSPNKDAAQIMLNERVREAEMGRAGVRDPFAADRKRPLAEHLADFEVVLTARGGGKNPRHVGQMVGYTRAVLDGCGFIFTNDLDAARVEQFIASLREGTPQPPLDPAKEWYTKKELASALGIKPHCLPPLLKRHRLEAKGQGKARRYPCATAETLREVLADRGASIETANRYLLAVKQFTRWLVDNDRLDRNPFARIKGGNKRLDRRHDRRALDAAELRQVLDAALASTFVFRGLHGRDRHHLYLVAMTTGFRSDELAALLPEWFSLDTLPPTATLPAEVTKNKTTATQPLPPDVAEALRAYLAGKPSGVPVWSGTWHERAADMLRIELDACGISYAVEGPDGPPFADFHALRHSFIALMDRSGLTVKEAMQLARHSDPKLTLAVYGKARLHDLGSAVEKLPRLLPTAPPRVTGTDG